MNIWVVLEVMGKCLFIASIIFCVFVSNIFFCIFRRFQASIPLYQNLLVNVFFSHLSFIWQAANLIHAVFLFTHFIFKLDNSLFSCILFHLVQYEVTLGIICIFFLSMAWCLAHFKEDIYLLIQHIWMETLSSVLLIFISVSCYGAALLFCNIELACNLQNECYDNILS